MYGTIATYSAQARGGVIRTAENNLHCFHLHSWQGDILPRTGQQVEFTIRGNTISDVRIAEQEDRFRAPRLHEKSPRLRG